MRHDEWRLLVVSGYESLNIDSVLVGNPINHAEESIRWFAIDYKGGPGPIVMLSLNRKHPLWTCGWQMEKLGTGISTVSNK